MGPSPNMSWPNSFLSYIFLGVFLLGTGKLFPQTSIIVLFLSISRGCFACSGLEASAAPCIIENGLQQAAGATLTLART